MEAGLGKNTLTSLLRTLGRKRGASFTLRVLVQLAERAGVHPSRLMGLEPPPERQVDEILLDALEARLGLLAQQVGLRSRESARTPWPILRKPKIICAR
jgi:hypothetical protein